MNVAASVRLDKMANPQNYCARPSCLWKTMTRTGPRPCQRHPVKPMPPIVRVGDERCQGEHENRVRMYGFCAVCRGTDTAPTPPTLLARLSGYTVSKVPGEVTELTTASEIYLCIPKPVPHYVCVRANGEHICVAHESETDQVECDAIAFVLAHKLNASLGKTA